MKIYQYLLFRIYRFFTDTVKEKNIPLLYVAAISSTLIYFNLFTASSFLEYKGLTPKIITHEIHVVASMVIIFILNFYLIIKRKKFLEFNFRKDAQGGALVFLYLFLTLSSTIIMADYHRNEEQAKQKQVSSKQKGVVKPSLEGDIKRWWRNNF